MRRVGPGVRRPRACRDNCTNRHGWSARPNAIEPEQWRRADVMWRARKPCDALRSRGRCARGRGDDRLRCTIDQFGLDTPRAWPWRSAGPARVRSCRRPRTLPASRAHYSSFGAAGRSASARRPSVFYNRICARRALLIGRRQLTARLASRFVSLKRANRARVSPAPLRGGGWGVGGVQTRGRRRGGTPPLPCPSPARGEGAL